ncbi:MAG: hypothetical protein J6B02_01210 [Selenomonadales bacterium]|nr:hypothetical protein [Selenomonadales bacterium]
MFMREVFFSRLYCSGVEDEHGRRLGLLRDIAVSLASEHPRVVGIRIGTHGYLPIGSVVGGLTGEVHRVPSRAVMRELQDDEWYAAELLLDKQVIDGRTKRVHRVNDIVFASCGREEVEERSFLAGVEVGLGGIWRRIRAEWLSRIEKERLVGWRDIILFDESDMPSQMTLQDHRLVDVSTEDIVEICRKLDYRQRGYLVRHLPQAVLLRAVLQLPQRKRIALISMLGEDELGALVRALPRGVQADVSDDPRIACRCGAEGGGGT